MKVQFLLTRLSRNINHIMCFNKKKASTSCAVYSFMLVSLISPYFITSARFFYDQNTFSRKLLLKQSYMLLTWFYYLTFLNDIKIDDRVLKFFVLPVKRSTHTLTKAPMAHKNWSKEQYKFQFFVIRITFCNKFKSEWGINNTNHALLFVLLSKKNFPFFETNMLFLKNYWFTFYFSDLIFFNYFKYVR